MNGESLQSLRRKTIGVLLLGCLFAVSPPLPAQTNSAATPTSTHKKKKSHKKVSSRRGQQKIDPQRAHDIQEALIREHYLSGKASGVWDDASQKAMQKFQADHGWQSKTTPDSRALIKLGLGPDHEHLLNPQSAMTDPPPAHAAQSTGPTAPADPQY
ncbi:Peptidoglycan-binding domain 1 (modular protein) [Candidatus Sulfotelmatobacter sp. SbA7]|nr:Peptidoglycan-binding domain 1 (modular protein) [Candidatus Sulfotelmatobacter sp. SbA7]